MLKVKLPDWLRDEDGAVTVDWVVLTAAVAVIGIIVLNLINPGIYEVSSHISDELSRAENLDF